MRRFFPTRRIRPGSTASYHSPGAKVGIERAVSFFAGTSSGPIFGCKLGATIGSYARTHSNATEDKISPYQLVMKPKPLIRKDMPLTFNHGVEGSSPSALTIQINYLASNFLLPTSGDSQRVHKRSTCGEVVQSPRDDPDALRVFAVAVVAIMHVAAELENQTVR